MKKKFFKKRNIIISLIMIFILACIISGQNSINIQKILMSESNLKNFEPINKNDKILILAPHPDDEAISSSGVIQEAIKVGAKVKIVYLTNGEYNQESFLFYEKRPLILRSQFLELGKIRMSEAENAMAVLGLKKDDLIFLGYPDFGTMDILVEHWDKNKPYSNILENISSVPYDKCLSYQKPYIGQNILNDLESIIKDFQPNKIIVSNPADLNRDHQALYVYLRVALLDLKNDLKDYPKIYTYLVHARNWPIPKGLNKDYQLNVTSNIKNFGDEWINLNLNKDEIDKKENAVNKYISQIKYSPNFLVSFVKKNELFSIVNDISLNVNSENNSLNNLNLKIDKNNQSNDNISGDYYIKDKYLYINIYLERKIEKDFGISIYLLSYSDKQDFSLMPKLHIVINLKGISVKDQFNIIEDKDLNYHYEGNNLILKVPLNLLNQPDYIITHIRTHSGNLIFHETAWKFLKISY
jgi:LmbE family N-acetylglucosaminyl deacetylase